MTIERLAGDDPHVPCDECDPRVPAAWRMTTRMVYLQLCPHHLRQLQAAIGEALSQDTEAQP